MGAVRRLMMLTVTVVALIGMALGSGLALRLFIWAAGI